MSTSVEPAVLVEQRGRLGLLTLNRPRSINALTHEMVTVVADTLAAWADDPSVGAVAVVGAGERGLCAGGDVVALRHAAVHGPAEPAVRFWADEYAMNALIARYPKPYVAIQDGIVLGGGIGISAHGSHRIVTERSRLGFPEVTIGFVPDVGATWLLTRAPGELGTRLALTGAQVGAADAILVGLSDHFVASGRIPELLAALETTDADDAIRSFSSTPGDAPLAAESSWTDEAFAGDGVARIVERLRTSDHDAAPALVGQITSKSPLALSVALAALRRGSALGSLEEALDQEFRVSTRHLSSPDFAEGVRAQVIDKDRAPVWQPGSLAEVTTDLVDSFFAESPWGSFTAVASKEKA